MRKRKNETEREGGGGGWEWEGDRQIHRLEMEGSVGGDKNDRRNKEVRK